MASVFYGSVDTRLAQLMRSVASVSIPPASVFGTRKPISSRATLTQRFSSLVLNESNAPKEKQV